MATTSKTPTRVPQLSRLQTTGLVLGLIGILGIVAGFLVAGPVQFAKAYIFGFYFSMAFPIGCLGFLMVQHLTGGAWGVTARRMLEAGALTMPVMFFLSLPVLATMFNVWGGEYVYKWADPSVITPGAEKFDPIIAHKVPWLSPTWVAARMVIYFAIWGVIAFFLRSWSLAQDRGAGSDAMAGRMRMLSGIGVALFVLSVTFFSFDVAMSIDAHWFSTIYGAHYMVNSGLTVLAFLILVMTQVRNTSVFQENVPIKPIHDLGKLMLAFTILWTYMSFGQYVIIWSGDVAEFTPWYVHRTEGGWLTVAMMLMALAFFGPFFALLGRKPKRNLNYLTGVAIVILVMRVVDMAWIVLPDFHREVVSIHWLNIFTPLGVFGIWLALFAFNLQRAQLLPFNAPQMESLQAGGHH